MIDLYSGYWNCCVFDFPMLCVWVLQWKCHHYFQTITSVNAMTILQISSSKRWASTFFFFLLLLLLCVVASRFDADSSTFIKIHFIQIHIANPKPQSGPPPSQELDKILDFFPCLSLCVCLHTHTHHQRLPIVDCVSPHGKSMEAMHIHIINQPLQNKIDCMDIRR